MWGACPTKRRSHAATCQAGLHLIAMEERAMWLKSLFLGTTLAIGVVACGTDVPAADESIGSVRQAIGETVTTDKASYTKGETVIASFTNLPGNAYDWVALSPQGSPANSYVSWAYTN